LNDKKMRKLIRKKEKELAERKRKARSRRVWGSILLIISAFSLVMIENLVKAQGKLTGIVFFTLVALVCFLYGLANLSIFKVIRRIFIFFTRLLGIRKIRVEIDSMEDKSEKKEDWADF
jgi:cobalamin biosynthesis protein CobD/CbiB